MNDLYWVFFEHSLSIFQILSWFLTIFVYLISTTT